ncbi:MAG: hypothetical protein JW807_16630 [Spirochaetes bacterium]|nr:hypothetical protein [Spirochaetota bacterium]
MSIDRGKLNAAMGRISLADTALRDGIRTFGQLVDRDKENLRSIISEAAAREAGHRSNVYSILKKMFSVYQTEMSGAVNILYTLTDKQDRVLSLSKKMTKGASHD